MIRFGFAGGESWKSHQQIGADLEVVDATCAQIICDSGYRILWMSHCHGGYSLDEVRGRHPWEFLTGEHAVNFQAAMARVIGDQTSEQLDIYGERIGYRRAWFYFCPLTDARISILIRLIPAAVRNLTPLDREICRLLSEGRTSKEIAARLDLNRKTIDSHRVKLAQQLGIPRGRLMAWCGENREWF